MALSDHGNQRCHWLFARQTRFSNAVHAGYVGQSQGIDVAGRVEVDRDELTVAPPFDLFNAVVPVADWGDRGEV
jgi:hypothetical protein